MHLVPFRTVDAWIRSKNMRQGKEGQEEAVREGLEADLSWHGCRCGGLG